ncbi:hypothetical protein Plhal304r1_c043g0123131 [Plasmopara halstedii]
MKQQGQLSSCATDLKLSRYADISLNGKMIKTKTIKKPDRGGRLSIRRYL